MEPNNMSLRKRALWHELSDILVIEAVDCGKSKGAGDNTLHIFTSSTKRSKERRAEYNKIAASAG